jgi:2-methylisocitrate lyase-like PEP mutase family enzyme
MQKTNDTDQNYQFDKWESNPEIDALSNAARSNAMPRYESRAAAFAALHRTKPGFIMPNAWDAGSAIVLATAGFPAIGTTSAGVAFSLGKPDYAVADRRFGVSRNEMLERAAEIAAAVCIPVNGDLEAGYGDTPDEVAATVRAAIDAGLAGCNIEDKQPAAGLYDEALAIERIRAARAAIDATDSRFVLTARCDALLQSKDGLREAIARSNRYREAGADCLFTPGVSDKRSIATLAREIDGPLNMVMGLGNADGTAHEWLDLGVQRISVGGSIARTALGLVRRAAGELRDKGTISFAKDQIPQAELNALFAGIRNRT